MSKFSFISMFDFYMQNLINLNKQEKYNDKKKKNEGTLKYKKNFQGLL